MELLNAVSEREKEATEIVLPDVSGMLGKQGPEMSERLHENLKEVLEHERDRELKMEA